MFKKYLRSVTASMITASMLPVFSIGAAAAADIGSASELADAVKTAGEYTLTDSFEIDQLGIGANVTINGNGNTLTGANTDLSQATVYHAKDGLSSVFENITLDGGEQKKEDTCLWLGRGSWEWRDVTVRNWDSVSDENRGAVTLGKSSRDAGELTVYGADIKNNHVGLSIADSEAICTVYSAVIKDNTETDARITSGTLNLLDSGDDTEKEIGRLSLEGGAVNISGNTSISELYLKGGTVNVTGDITSSEGITILLPSYTDGAVVATVSDEAVLEEALNDLHLPEEYADVCSLEASGQNIILRTEETIVNYDTKVEVDYSQSLGTSNRIASGVLHAVDYKTPAEYLSDGIYLRSVRGQAHQKEFDNNYEYLPGFFDKKTYERLNDINPDSVLMMGLYYGFKPQHGSEWQNAALDNGGALWKEYIAGFMNEAYDSEGNKAIEVYSWIPWNEPDLQWRGNMSGFHDAFKYGYEAVKEFDPRELVQGPELSSYNFSTLTAFLSYCRDNDCLPDVLSWHELRSYPLDIEAHCAELEEWMLENGIEPMPMAVTEYQGTGYGETDEERISQGTYNPGLTVAYIASMERAEKYGLDHGLKSAWGRTGSDPEFMTDLGQMADFETGTMPTGLWYVYHAYKNMTGRKLETVHDSSEIEAAAAYDSSADRLSSTVIIGNWEETKKYVQLTLNDIPEELSVNGMADVKIEAIAESLADPLYQTDVLMDGECETENGDIILNIAVNGRSAVAVTVTPPADENGTITLPLETNEHSENITVTEKDGAVYAEGGLTSSYIEEAPEGNEKNVTYKDTGDNITFSAEVSDEGIYKFEGLHISGNDMGFMQLYVDGEALGEPVDLYSEEQAEKTVNYGNICLTPGTHEFTFKIVGFGKNEKSSGTDLSFKSLSLVPVYADASAAKVSFDANGSETSLTQSSSLVISGSALGYLPETEREDHKLISWNTKPDGTGDEVTEDTIITDDITVYAQWKEDISVELAGDTENAELVYENGTATVSIKTEPEQRITVKANRIDITDLFEENGDMLVLKDYEITGDTIFIIKITEADHVSAVVIEGNSITLPEKVMAWGEDGYLSERDVTWNYSTIRETGTKHTDKVTGTFDGGTVTAEVTVLPCSEDIGEVTSTASGAGTVSLGSVYADTFTAEFDVVFDKFSAENGSTCSFIAFGSEEAGTASWNNFGPQIIVEGDGTLKARSGNGNGELVSTSNASVKLETGQSYRIRLDINVPEHTYDAWVIYPDGTAEQFGTAARFRTNMDEITLAAVQDSDNVNEFKLSSFKLSMYTDAPLEPDEPHKDSIEPIGIYAGKLSTEKELSGNTAVFTIKALDGDMTDIGSLSLICAEYGSDGSLINVQISSGEITENGLTLATELPQSGAYKIMIWDTRQRPIMQGITETET